jgi:hypothetical protein
MPGSRKSVIVIFKCPYGLMVRDGKSRGEKNGGRGTKVNK